MEATKIRKGQWVTHPSKGVGIVVQEPDRRNPDVQVLGVHWVDERGETRMAIDKAAGKVLAEHDVLTPDLIAALSPAAVAEIPEPRRPR